MVEPNEEPREVADLSPEDEERLNGMTTEEAVALIPGGGPLPPDSTCETSWTFVCDTHPPMTTCITGLTLKCDDNTCTTGWTLRCDTRSTCRTGWTFVCDDFA